MKKFFLVITVCGAFLSWGFLEGRRTFNFQLRAGQEVPLSTVIQNALRKPRANFLVGVDGNKNLTNDSNAIVNSMGAGKRRC